MFLKEGQDFLDRVQKGKDSVHPGKVLLSPTCIQLLNLF